jgi:hypothetical protein
VLSKNTQKGGGRMSFNLRLLLAISIYKLSKIIKNDIRLTVSGLGTVTGTTRRVFPLVFTLSRPNPMEMDPCLEVLWFADIFSKRIICIQKQHLPYPFTIYPFTDDQSSQTDG